MPIDWVAAGTALREWATSSVRTMLTLFLFSGYVALAPARWLIKTHLEGFSNHYQTYVWIAFLLTGIWLVYTVAEHSGRLVVSGFQRHNHKQGMRKYLEIMPNDQISILLRYVQKGCSSLQQDPSNGAVRDLENRGFLYRSSELGSMNSFAYTLTDTARYYLGRKDFNAILLERLKKPV
jgi:Super-infection exclusion protein B